jgi:hypothetical protein
MAVMLVTLFYVNVWKINKFVLTTVYVGLLASKERQGKEKAEKRF